MTITINANMFAGIPYDASMAGIKVGEEYTIRDLLYGTMLPSGADAVQALSYSIFGNVSNHVNKMNELVSELGLTNTHFVNVTGYTEENHYSTSSDMLVLLDYALNNETFKKIYKTKKYEVNENMVFTSSIRKYNSKLELDTSRILGSKTGYTNAAGLCLSSLYESNGHEIIMITLGAEVTDQGYHIQDAVNLIDFIDKNYDNQILISKGMTVASIKVIYGKNDTYSISPTKDIKKYLPSDFEQNNIEVIYEGIDSIKYNEKVGTKLGKLSYYYNNELIEEEDVYLEEEQEFSLMKWLEDYYYIPLISLILFVILILIISSIFNIVKKNKK